MVAKTDGVKKLKTSQLSDEARTNETELVF